MATVNTYTATFTNTGSYNSGEVVIHSSDGSGRKQSISVGYQETESIVVRANDFIVLETEGGAPSMSSYDRSTVYYVISTPGINTGRTIANSVYKVTGNFSANVYRMV